MEGMEEGVERDESHDLREYSWRQAHEIETRGFVWYLFGLRKY